MSLTVFLVTGGVLALFFLACLALIGHANRVHEQRLLDRSDPDGPDGPVQPTLPDLPE